MNIEDTFKSVQKASRKLNLLEDEEINSILKDLANGARKNTAFILRENQKDLDRMDPTDPKYDRLKLTEERIEDIAGDIEHVAGLASPLNKKLVEKTLDNGLELAKVTVPLGVIGVIYEARPNVTFDVFSLCLKSGNACVLKGGSDAIYSNQAILQVIHEVLNIHSLDQDVVTLLPAGREAAEALLHATDYVDIIIPRGSQSLIDYVRDNARVPVIETGAGIVHNYFDESADIQKGKAIIHNAKTRRPSVCNSLDCLLIHQSRVKDLPELTASLATAGVEIFADKTSFEVLKGHYPEGLLKEAKPEHFGTEFLALKMSIKTVSGLDEALDQIATYSSKHSEAIISENEANINKFLKSVDAAALYANSSTAFTDGAQFGLGAEIGISTQKLHARGPMALEELTTYKWIVKGKGQIRA